MKKIFATMLSLSLIVTATPALAKKPRAVKTLRRNKKHKSIMMLVKKQDRQAGKV